MLITQINYRFRDNFEENYVSIATSVTITTSKYIKTSKYILNKITLFIFSNKIL